MKLITIIVSKPLIAGLRDNYYSFRVYRKADGSDVKVFNQEDEKRKELKDYVKCEFIFPRYPDGNIDWFSYFAHVLETFVKKEAGASKFKMISVSPNAKIYVVTMLFKGIVSAFEAVAPQSVFNIVADTDAKNGKYVIYIGRFRNKGFGESIIEIKDVNK